MTGLDKGKDWDAPTYDRVSDPQVRWALPVLDRLCLAGDERVLDAGCGSGRVTELLLGRLPRGEVVAVDASPAMLAEARRRLAPFAARVDFVPAELGAPSFAERLGHPVDAVFSTATFHWVPDHVALFANLAAALRPGGALVAQCGGHGNVAGVLRAAADVGLTSPVPFEFATPEATIRRLRDSGFCDIWAWLQPEPTPLAPCDELETYLATVVLRTFLTDLDDADRAAAVHQVATRLPAATIDYVRLNILARRAPVRA